MFGRSVVDCPQVPRLEISKIMTQSESRLITWWKISRDTDIRDGIVIESCGEIDCVIVKLIGLARMVG